jgi:hypothetical protein
MIFPMSAGCHSDTGSIQKCLMKNFALMPLGRAFPSDMTVQHSGFKRQKSPNVQKIILKSNFLGLSVLHMSVSLPAKKTKSGKKTKKTKKSI